MSSRVCGAKQAGSTTRDASDEIIVEPNTSLQPLYDTMYARYLYEIESQARKKQLHPQGRAATVEGVSLPHTGTTTNNTQAVTTSAAPTTPTQIDLQPALFIDGRLAVRIGTLPCPRIATAKVGCSPDPGAKIDPGSDLYPDVGVELDVDTVGVCGSDMHYYKDGGIGATIVCLCQGCFILFCCRCDPARRPN